MSGAARVLNKYFQKQKIVTAWKHKNPLHNSSKRHLKLVLSKLSSHSGAEKKLHVSLNLDYILILQQVRSGKLITRDNVIFGALFKLLSIELNETLNLDKIMCSCLQCNNGKSVRQSRRVTLSPAVAGTMAPQLSPLSSCAGD